MTDIILGIGVATFIVYTAFHISYILNIKRTSEQVSDILFELRDTLENLKMITGNVNAVSEDVRQVSRSVAIVEKSIRGVFHYGKANLGPATGAKIAGLKAGIATGVTTLAKSLKQRRRVHHERRIWS
jgi:hypothetical protein